MRVIPKVNTSPVELWTAPSDTAESRTRSVGKPIQEIRKELWLEPDRLLACLVRGRLSKRQLLDSIRIAPDDNTALVEGDAEELGSAVKSQSSQCSDAEDESKAEKRLRVFVAETKDTPVLSKAQEEAFHRLLGGVGWRCESPDFSREWWRLELVYVAPWFSLAKKSKMKVGLDFFFCAEDVRRYLLERGNKNDIKRPVDDLQLDLTSPEWNLDKRIHQLACDVPDPFDYNLEPMLLESGWKKFNLRKPYLSRNSIYVPYWATDFFAEDILTSLTAQRDFFPAREDVVQYIKEHGNNPVEKVSGSPRTSTRSRVESSTPESPESHLKYIVDTRLTTYRADTKLWALLKDCFGWQHVNVSMNFHASSIYLAPWAAERFEAGGKRHPDNMVLKRDFFYDTQSVLHYVVKYGNAKTDAPLTPEDCSRHRKSREQNEPPPSAKKVASKRQSEAASQLEAEAPNEQSRKAKKPKVEKKTASLTLLPEHLRGLAIDLLSNLQNGDDLRLHKCILPVAKAHKMRWFYTTRLGVGVSIFSFNDEVTSSRLHEFTEGQDYFVNEENFLEHIHSNLALLGYIKASNTMDPSFTVDLEYGASPVQRGGPDEATPGYRIKPPLNPRRDQVINKEPSDISDRYSHAKDSYMAAPSPSMSVAGAADSSAALIALLQTERPASHIDDIAAALHNLEEPWSWDNLKAGTYRNFNPPKDATKIFMRFGVSDESDARELTLNEDYFFDDEALIAFLRGKYCPEKSRKRALSDVTNTAVASIPRPPSKSRAKVQHPAAPQESIADRIEAAKRNMLPSARPSAVVARDAEIARIHDHISEALREGTGAGVYLCGLSGIGKTLSVESVLADLETQREGGLCANFIVTRACGAGLTTPFTYLAETLDWKTNAVGWDERQAQKACMKHFTPSTTQSNRSGGAKHAFHILFIDEIDKAPRPAVKALFEACAEDNSRLIVIGIANDIAFTSTLHLSDDAIPEVIVFKPLTREQLKSILMARARALFSDRAADLLAMKVAQKGIFLSTLRLTGMKSSHM